MAASDSANTVLVWDSESPHPTSEGKTLLWRGFVPSGSNVVSVPQLIEERADHLRARYLAWVYELGRLSIDGRSLADHLELREGFSYWWMTLLVEKCNYGKSPYINDAIRCLALDHWASGRIIRRLSLASNNQSLADCLRRWCRNTGVDFEWRRLPRLVARPSLARRSFAALPSPLRAGAWLIKYLLARWPLRGVGLETWCNSKGKVTFVSYFFNLVPESVSAGRYESLYWGNLPNELLKDGYKTNWLHLYVPSELCPNAKKAARAVQKFNETGANIEIHTTLDTFLSLTVLLQALRDWIKLAQKGRKLEGVLDRPTQCGVDLYPLFKEDWRESTYGVTAMSNTLYRSLFDAAFKVLPKQKLGLYLQENQNWEFALIPNWKMSRHGQLIGVPHSTLRFWDLRYFSDQRSYSTTRIGGLPLPDKVAVNGQASLDVYIDGGYPPSHLVEVEALRYLYLLNMSIRASSPPQTKSKGLRLLVVGDYLVSNTRRQMSLLAQSAASLPFNTKITIKPHPACPIHARDYPELRLAITNSPLVNLLAETDAVYSSATTSASMDAYCAGVPVISLKDPAMLNMSPLRGYEGTAFVISSDELVKELHAILSGHSRLKSRSNIFNLNISLPLWRRLLTRYV